MGINTSSRQTAQGSRSSKSKLGRLRLLGSGSAMAGAIALASIMSSSAVAQSIPQNMQSMPIPEIALPTEGNAGVNGPMMRSPANDRASIARPNVHSFPTPIASNYYVERRGLTLNPPTVLQAQVNSSQPAVAPPASPNTVIVPPSAQNPTSPGGSAAAAPSGTVTTFSSTPAPSPGDTDTNGINVLATANYFSSEINFTPTAAVDIVDVLASEAIINWTTFTAGTATTDVTFLGAAGNLRFNSTLGDYTVLNRIFTPGIDSAVRIDGTIISEVLGGADIGGNIWFYSPGGMIIGSTGRIAVGSLVLSSSDLDSIDAGGSQLNFLGVAEPDTAIVVEAGAQIGTGRDGYVAMVAPRVEQHGVVVADGSIAYIAAEQAQMTINNGLFDITVGVGTADANGVVHTGTTTGDASQATVNGIGQITDADARGIYMVAVPKNTALTMLVGGDIGYAAAEAAAVTDNGTIILSAGANVTQSGGIDAPTINVESDTAIDGGSIEFTGGAFTSDVTTVASEDITIFPQFGEALLLGSDGRGAYSLDLSAGNEVTFGAGIGGVIQVEGDVSLRAGLNQALGGVINLQSIGNVAGPGDPVFGNGQVTVGGNLTLDASGSGRDDYFTIRNNGGTGVGEAAVGGTINLNVTNNARIDIAGNLTLDASAQGGHGEVIDGNGTGGSINLTVDGGTLDVVGSAILTAGTLGASDNKFGGNGAASEGSDSIGGDVTINLISGSFDAGAVAIDASAGGSSGSDDTIEQDNQGIAGSVEINVTGGVHTLGSLNISAGGTGAGSFDATGDGIVGGAGRGTVDVNVSGTDSTLNITGDLDINVGTSGSIIDPVGNVVSLVAQNTGTGGGLLVGDDIIINTSARNGSETAVTTAGSISVLADGSTISFDALDFNAVASPSGDAFFLFGGGRDFRGGDITIDVTGSGSISGRRASLSTSATGSDATGGDGTGGTIAITADDGRFALTSSFFARASGQGGAGIDPLDSTAVGVGQGGNLIFTVRGAGGSIDLNFVSVNTDGSIFNDVEGGSGPVLGNGGNGIAGDVTFNIEGGTFDAGSVSISADGFGGLGGDISGSGGSVKQTGLGFFDDLLDVDAILADGQFASAFRRAGSTDGMVGLPGAGSGGRGGDGVGGTVEFNLTGGTATVANLSVTADGIGGDGAPGDFDAGEATGDGGDAFGGTATFNALSGSLTVTNELSVTARGNTEFSRGDGGDGDGVAGGAGGSATGGDAIFNMTGTATINAGTVVVSADAFGGRGGDGNERFDGSTFIAGEAGGAGGSGTAGNAVFNNTSGDISFTTLTVSADGEGGVGGSSFGISVGEATNDGGLGGDGIGGTATINLNQDDATTPTYIAQARGTGGDGGRGLDSGSGGNGTGGTARINVNDVSIALSTARIDASATGGDGGLSDGEGGDGGDGGNGVAGSAILDVNGSTAVFSSDGPLEVIADGTGGAGADGQSPGFGIAAPGNGGAGGSAQGGLIRVISRDGADVGYLASSITSASGSAGSGGNGGSSNFDDSSNGDGGDAGSAVGGTIEFTAATGGSLAIFSGSGAFSLNADGIGQIGGNGGNLSDSVIGIYGQNSESNGGTVTLSAQGAGSSLSVGSDLTVNARSLGVSDERPDTVGAPGRGGTILVSATDGGSFEMDLRTLSLVATARASDGRFNAGAATGGTVNVSATNGSLMRIGALNINADSQAGLGRRGRFAGGRDGGDAVGGNVNVSIDQLSSLDLPSLIATARGNGGFGGDANFGPSAGAGGNGTGGSLTVDLQGTVTNLQTLALEAAGVGGFGGAGGLASSGSVSGAGGDGIGGTAILSITDTDLPDLIDLTLTSEATGGEGGEGTNIFTAGGGTTTDGAVGGNATGGRSALILSGAGASFTVDSGTIQIRADATGGNGGRGGGHFAGGEASDGGVGGDATGGAVEIIANSGTTINLADGGSFPFTLTSSGQGGTGGSGGGIDMASGGTIGNGSDGGVGTGGSPTLRAIGGAILGGDLQLVAVGRGGNGGAGGFDGASFIGATGNGGNGEGGTPLVEVLEGSPGVITLNNVDLLANGVGGSGTIDGLALGGLVTINDLSTDPAGLISLGSLDVDASGATAVAGGGFVMNAGSGPVTITNDMVINTAGDIVYNFDGTGQVVVGGRVQLNTLGNVAISHANNSGSTLSFDVAGDFVSSSGGNFATRPGSIIDSGNEMFVVAGGDISADDLRAIRFIILQAQGSVLLNDATAIGPQGISNAAGIIIDAGFDSNFGSPIYDPTENATITGTVRSYRDVIIRSGGNAVFALGSEVIADNSLSVRTGDDIIIAAGASLSSANNPTDAVDASDPFGGGPNLSLLAGDITNLSAVPVTPLASLVIDGIVDANAGAVILTGDAVDALDATITASSVAADINDAPANAVTQGNDNGLLSTNCVQGNVCLGNISADNRIEIGQASNNDVIALVIEQGTVNAQDILITTRADIVMGTTGIATTLNASNQFSATSTEGDVNLLDASISSDSILIDAAGSLLGTASLTSTGDIGIDVGADLNALLIDAGGQLTTVAGVGGGFEGTYNVAGDIDVGTYNQGADFQFRVIAGGDISFDAVNINGTRDVILAAGGTGPGDVFLGTASGTRNITLTGDNISFTDLNAGLFLDLNTLGSITGGSLTSGSLMTLVGGSIDVGAINNGFILNATATAGDLSTGAITSDSTIRFNATGNLTTLDIDSAGAASINADGNIDVGTVTTTGGIADVTLNATGTLNYLDVDGSRLVTLNGTAITGGNVLGFGQVDVNGTSIDIDDVRSTNGFVDIETTIGDIITGNLTADRFGVRVTSAAAADIGDIDSAGTIFLDTVGNAIVGDAGTATNLTFDIGGNLTAGVLDAQSNNLGMSVGVTGNANIESANTLGLMTFNVDGALTGGDITGGSLTRLTAGSINLTSANSTNQALTIVTNIGDAVLASTTSGNGTTLTAAGDVDVGTATSGSFVTLRGDSVTLDAGTITGNLTLDARAGDVTGTGAIMVGGNINLDATGDIGFGTLNAQGTVFTADAGGAITFTGATSGGSIGFTADSISFDNITSVSATSLTTTGGAANSITGGTIDTAGTGDVTLTSDGLIDVGDVTARILTANAGTDLTLGVVDAIGRNIRGIAINLDAGGTISYTSLLSGRGIDIDSIAVNGGNVTSDNGITVDADSITVGDILITEIGGVVLNAANGALSAGDLTSHTFALDIRSSGVMNVGDLAVTGNSNSSDITVVSGGNTTLGDVAAGDRLVMDITGDLTTGALTSNNNSPGMRIDVTGDAAIASASDPDGPIRLTIGGALTGGDFTTNGPLNLDAGSIDIDSATANGGIGFVNVTTMTGNAAIDVISAGNDINVDVGGDFTFITATAADDIDLVAGGSVLGGDLTATGDLDIDANNIAIGDADATNIALISATNLLFDSLTSPNRINLSAINGTIGANTGNGDINGDGDVTLTSQIINVGDVTSGGSVGATATAGDATFATVDAATNITISATGTPSVVNAISGGNTNITGASVTLNNGTIGGNLTLDATAGDIDGNGTVTVGGAIDFDATGAVGFGSLNAQGGNFTVDAGGAVTFTGATSSVDVIINTPGAINGGDITATGTAQLDGGDIALGDVDAANIDLTSGADILFNSLTSPNAIILSALNGTIGANTGNGDIDSDDDVTLTAEIINVGDVTSGGSIGATATAGDATFGTVDATTDITISATGTPTVANAISGGNTNVTGASVTFNNGAIGGNLTLNATAGDIDGNGAVTVGGAIDFDATDGVGFGSLNAQGGNFTVDAGGAVTFTGATSSADVVINTPGAINGGDVTATGTAQLDGGSIALGDVDAENIDLTSGADILFNSLTSPNAINVSALNGMIGANTGSGDIDSDGDITLTAQALNVGDLTSGGSIAANATAGNAGFGIVDAADDIVITASGTPTIVSVVSGGSTTITGASVFLGSGSVGQDLILTATDGDIDATQAGLFQAGNDPLFGADPLLGGNSASFRYFTAFGGVGFAAAPGDNITVGGVITLDASDNVRFENLNAQGGNFTVTAGENVTFESATAADTVSIDAGGNIVGRGNLLGPILATSFGSIDATNNVILSAADIDLATITAGGAVSASATGGNIVLTNIDAVGLVDLDATGFITVDHAETDDDFVATAIGNFTTGLNTIITGGDIIINADIVNLGNSMAGGLIDVTGSQIDFNAITAGATIALETITLTSSNGSGDITGVDMTAGPDASSAIAVGSVNITGNSTIGGSLSLDAGANIVLGTVVTQTGGVGADAVGTITYGSIDSADDISMFAGGLISGGDLTAITDVLLDGGDIAIGDVTADTIDITTGADILFDSLNAPTAITLTALTGSIAANTGAGDIDSGGDVSMQALDIDVGNVISGGSVSATATAGDATFGTVDAVNNITISATGTPTIANAISGGNTSVTGASVTLNNGTIGGNLTLNATAGDIDGNGTVSVGGAIDFDATGAVGFGSLNAQGGNFTVDAGGAITFTGATSSADILFNTPGAINGGDLTAVGTVGLDGGNIAIGDVDAANIDLTSSTDILFNSLTSPNAINVSALNGTIGANTGSGDIESDDNVTLTAQTIDVGNVTSGGSVNADATLGAAKLGAINAAGNSRVTAAGTLTVGDVSITNLGAGINLFASGAASDIVAGALTTNGGDILVSAERDISLSTAATSIGTPTSGSIGLLAGRNVTATGLLSAGEDVAVRALGDVTLADAQAGDDVTVQADGAITVGALTTTATGIDLFSLSFDAANAGQVGSIAFAAEGAALAGSSIQLTSGSDITAAGTLDAHDNITVSATGTPSLVNAISGGNTSVTGASVTFNNGTIGGDLTLNATAGDIDGNGTVSVGGAIDFDATGAVGFGSLNAQGGNFTVDAGGAITFTGATSSSDILFNTPGVINGGDLTATGTVGLDGGNIAIGDVDAANIDLTSGADILFNSLTSPNAINVTALNGTIGANTGNGDIDSDDDATLTAQVINVGGVASGGSVRASATAGDATFGTVDATENITITATGTPTVANAISGGSTSITGASVALGDGTIGGDLSLNAVAGNIFRQGTVDVAGSIDLDATGFIGIGRLNAQGGSLTADAGGDISFTEATANTDVLFTAGGRIIGADVAAGGTANLSGDSIFLGSVTATDIVLDGDTGVGFETLDATGTTTLTALNGAIFAIRGFGNIDSGDAVSMTAQSIDLGNIVSGGSIGAVATNGDAAFGTVDALDDITITASGTPTVANAISGGNTSITGSSVSLSNGTIGGDLVLNATAGDVDGNGTVTVAGGIDMTATGDIGFGTLNAQGGDFTADAGGNIAFTSATASGLIDFVAGGAIAAVGDVTAGGTLDLEALTGGITAIDLMSSGDMTLRTADGATINDATASAGSVRILGDGNVALGDITSASFVGIFIDGDVSFGDISSIGTSGVDVTGAVTGNSLDAGGAIGLTAATVDVATINSDDEFIGTATVGSFNAGSVTASEIDISSVTQTIVGSLDALTRIEVDAGSIQIGTAEAGVPNFGLIRLSADGSIVATGPISSTGQVTIGSANGSFTGADIAAGGDVSITAETMSVGDVTSDGSIIADAMDADASFGAIDAANDITITAAGTPSFTSVTSGGDTAITGATIAFSNGDIGGNLALTSTIDDVTGSGTTTAGGDIDVFSAGAISFADVATPGGRFFATADGDVTVGAVSTATGIFIDAANGGDITATSLTSDQDIGINASGAFTAQSVLGSTTGSFVSIDANDAISIGTLTGRSGVLDSVTGAVIVDTDIDIAGLLTASGTAVSLRSLGNLTTVTDASNGNIDIDVDGDLDLAGATANGNITATSGGSTTVNAAPVITTTPPNTAVSQGTQQATAVTGFITFNAGTDLVVNSAVSAATDLTMNAGGLIDLQATASGNTITTESADINIGTLGALGRSDQTSSIDISTDGDILLGGAGGNSSGFELDNDEFSRVHSGGDVTITAAGDNSLTVDDLGIGVNTGAGTPTDGNIGLSGTLLLFAGEDVDVIGNATMGNATADTTLAITAGNVLSIDPDSGNLRVEDANAAITGSINLTGDSIIAASDVAENDAANGTVADADIRLGQNDGATRDDGYIQGGTVTFTVDDALLIQNSGAGTEFDDRRGVVADNVSINSANSDAIIIFNGIVGGNAGLDTIPATGVPTDFDQASTINGCLIIDPASCAVVITPNPPVDEPTGEPVQDLIEEQIEGSNPVEGKVGTILVDFREDPERELDPLIDEPVTGAGNEDFWVSDEEEVNCDDPEGFCPAEGELEPAE